MLAILNSLNAHNFPIFQPILKILVSKFMIHRTLSDKTYLILGLLSPLIKQTILTSPSNGNSTFIQSYAAIEESVSITSFYFYRNHIVCVPENIWSGKAHIFHDDHYGICLLSIVSGDVKSLPAKLHLDWRSVK